VVSKIAVAVAAHERSDSTSAPPDDLLISTLKRLFGTSDWLPNSPGGHVWYGQDGLYLLWPESAIKILQSLPKGARAIPGFGSHDDLLGHLAARGLIAEKALPQVSIRPPGSTKPHAAVRVLEPSQLFPDREPRATALQLRLALLDSDSGESVKSESSLSPACAEGQTLSKADNQERTLAIEPNISGREPAVTVAELPARDVPQELTLDTSRILNPRSRELVDSVVTRLEHSFDKMLAKLVPDGVFVALAEFVGQHGDGASIVRALQEAELLAIPTGPSRRPVRIERMEAADVAGIVLAAGALQGYGEWVARWHTRDE
jgi:conjugal transfer pilus assembly protein TraI